MNESIVIGPDSFVRAKVKLTLVLATLVSIQVEHGGGEKSPKVEQACKDLVEAMRILHMEGSD